MDAIRAGVSLMRQEEQKLRLARLEEMDAAYRTALISGVLSGLLGAALTLGIYAGVVYVGMASVDVVSTDVSESFQIEHLPQAHEKREQIRTMANKAREGRGVRTVLNE